MRSVAARHVLSFFLALLLAACGGATKLAYEHGDAAVLVLADGYLDLEGHQWKVAREGIQRFHAWHRRNELPPYAALLNGAAGRVQRGLAPADIEWGIETVRTRYASLVGAAVRDAGPLLGTLDARNIDALQRRFAADDRKRVREQLSGDEPKRERNRTAAIAKRLESWTGPLSSDQLEVIRRFVRATADHPRAAHEYRLRRQRELIALLEQDGAPSPDRLLSFFLAWEEKAPARQRDYRARFAQLMLELDRTLTPAQRAHVVAQLRRYADDARQLSPGG
jgi:Family of unknown function (DUF6279)